MSDVQSRVFSNPDGAVTLALTFYKRVAAAEISDTVITVIREEVRKVILEDAEFRAKIRAAIDAAVATLPIEALSAAVSAAVTAALKK